MTTDSQGNSAPAPFTEAEKNAVYRVIRERRDMRHFTSQPIDPAVLQRLLEAAHAAPSVGLMQPWRFVRVTDRALRLRLHTLVDEERRRTAAALSERQDEFMRLKVEGMLECAEVLVVALCDGRERHVFGRRTLPEMDLASVACAIQNMWLAARAEEVGMGWVSLFDPAALAELLSMPEGSKPVAILCLGHVPAFYPAPMLEMERWRSRDRLAGLVFRDAWGQPDAAPESG
jgi:5,6-dimethylbenzimidazole synthase